MSGRGTVPSASDFLALGLLLEALLRLVVTAGSWHSDWRLGAGLTLTTGVIVTARVRVIERVTGIFKTTAHSMGVVFEQRDTVLSINSVNRCDPQQIPGDADSSTLLRWCKCGDDGRSELLYIKHLLSLQSCITALHPNLHQSSHLIYFHVFDSELVS